MSVKIREYKKRGKSGWEVDIMFKWPDGELYRERVKAPVGSKWARRRGVSSGSPSCSHEAARPWRRRRCRR